jgi:hypothetical protein
MASTTQEQERSFALPGSAHERRTIGEGHGSSNHEGGVGSKEQRMVDRVGHRCGDSRLKRLRENRGAFADVYEGEQALEPTQLSFDDAKARSPYACGLVCRLCWSPSSHCRGTGVVT